MNAVGTKPPSYPLSFPKEEDFKLYIVQRLSILETKMSFIAYMSTAALGSVLAILGAVITILVSRR